MSSTRGHIDSGEPAPGRGDGEADRVACGELVLFGAYVTVLPLPASFNADASDGLTGRARRTQRRR